MAEPSPRVGPLRAYAEVAGLFLVVLGVDVINAVRDGWAAVFGAAPGWLAWWNNSVFAMTDRAMFLVGVLWLVSLRPWDRVRLDAVVGGLAVLVGLRIVSIAVVHQSPNLGVSLKYLAWTGLTVALAGALAHRRGLTLAGFGLGRPHGQDWRSTYGRAEEIFFFSFAGLMVASALAMGLAALPGFRPAPTLSAASGVYDVFTNVIASVQAGICEEVVLVATLVTVLEAARRPAWQIYAVGGAMRLAVHLYFGLVAPAALVLAVTNIWLFRRTRRLVPIVVAHVAVDLFTPIRLLGGPLALPIVFATFLAVDAVITRRYTRRPSTPQEEPS